MRGLLIALGGLGVGIVTAGVGIAGCSDDAQTVATDGGSSGTDGASADGGGSSSGGSSSGGSSSGTTGGCKDDGACSGATPHCDSAAGVCRACVLAAHCADNAKPVCDPATHTCVAKVVPQCSGATDKEADLQCTAAKPACVSGLCSVCSSNARCEARDPMKPSCDSTSPDSAVKGTCRACTQDNECASGVCIKAGDCGQIAPVTGLSVGQCVPVAQVTAVTPASIVGALAGTAPYLKLAAGDYGALNITRSVALVGPGRDGAAGTTAVLDSVSVNTTGTVTLSDLQVTASAANPAAALTCRGQASVCMMRTRVLNAQPPSGRGIDGESDCKSLTVERSRVQSKGNAVRLGSVLTGPIVTYRLVNNIIVRSGVAAESYAVSLGKTSAGRFAHNTLLDNASSVACNNNQELVESILAGPVGTTAQSGCTAGVDVIQDLVEDTDIKAGTDFMPVLDVTQANVINKVIDKAGLQSPPVTVDYNGKARGFAAGDRGAQELN